MTSILTLSILTLSILTMLVTMVLIIIKGRQMARWDHNNADRLRAEYAERRAAERAHAAKGASSSHTETFEPGDTRPLPAPTEEIIYGKTRRTDS